MTTEDKRRKALTASHAGPLQALAGSEWNGNRIFWPRGEMHKRAARSPKAPAARRSFTSPGRKRKAT